MMQPAWKNQHPAGRWPVANLSDSPWRILRYRTRPHACDVPRVLKENVAAIIVRIDVVDAAEEGIGMAMDDARSQLAVHNRPAGGQLHCNFRGVDSIGTNDLGDVLVQYPDKLLHPWMVVQSVSAVPSQPRRAPTQACRIAPPLLLDQLHEFLVQHLVSDDIEPQNRGRKPIDAGACGAARRLR